MRRRVKAQSGGDVKWGLPTRRRSVFRFSFFLEYSDDYDLKFVSCGVLCAIKVSLCRCSLEKRLLKFVYSRNTSSFSNDIVVYFLGDVFDHVKLSALTEHSSSFVQERRRRWIPFMHFEGDKEQLMQCMTTVFLVA